MVAASPFLGLPVRAVDQLTSFELPNAVPLKTISTIHRLRAAGKAWKAFGCYPVFTVQTPLTALAGNYLRKNCLQDFKSSIPELKTSAANPELNGPFYYQEAPQVILFEPNHLISTADLSDDYTGGAHDQNGVDCTNFGLVNGKARVLTLGDFFLPGSHYRTFVKSALLAKLKNNPAAGFVQDGSMDWSPSYVLENFAIYPDGLVWEFNPYVAGPFSSGIIPVRLTWAELGPGLNQAMRP